MSAFIIARNAFYNLAGFFVSTIVTVLLVPVMFRSLGVGGFGVWAIVRVFISYASLGDLGLNNTLTRFIADRHAKRDSRGIETLLQSGLLLYTTIAAVLFISVFVLQNVIVETFFSTADVSRGELQFVLLGSLSVFLMNLIFSVFSAALTGIQRLDITNGVAAVAAVVNGALMYYALVSGAGLRGLVYASAVTTAISIVLQGVAFFLLLGRRNIFPLRIDLATIRDVFRYSKHIFIGAVANSIHLHFDKLLLSSYLNLSVVSSYEIASRVIQQVRQIPILLLNPILPAAAELEGRQEHEKVLQLYHRSMKYILALMLPLFGLVCVFASPLIHAWLGAGNDLAIATLQILVVANFLNLLTGPGYFLSLGIGKPQFAMYSSVAGLLLNVVLSPVLLYYFGYFGSVWGTFTALTFASVFFLILIQRDLRIGWSSLPKLLIIPLAVFAVSAAAGLFLSSFLGSPLLKLLLSVALSLILYAVGVFKLGYIDNEDRLYLRQLGERLQSKFLPA